MSRTLDLLLRRCSALAARWSVLEDALCRRGEVTAAAAGVAAGLVDAWHWSLPPLVVALAVALRVEAACRASSLHLLENLVAVVREAELELCAQPRTS